MDFTEFSIRYAIFCGAALAVVYLLVSLAGLVQIKLRQRRRQRALTLDGEEVYWISPEPGLAVEEERKQEPARPPQAVEPRTAPFSEQLFRSGLEAEMQQLRNELNSVKENMAQIKAARRVSPQYNEAMRLAQGGMAARDIADECGISLGEAELVLSLSRNKQEYEDHER